MTTFAPGRSLEQRMDALRRANEIRTKRAVFKRDLKSGRAELLPLLIDPPDWIETAKVTTLLLALPAFGSGKTDTALKACGASACKTIRGLSERQRAELIAHLRERAPEAKPRWTGRQPQGTDPRTQHMQAHARSNDIRLNRAAIRRQVFAGERTVPDVLREMPACVASMTLFDLVACQYRWGAHRTRRLLVRLGIPETKALGTLTQRQVGLVVNALEGKS